MESLNPNKHGKGDGSTFLRSRDGRWCATLPLPSPDGKRRRVTRLANPNTEAGAKKALVALRRELASSGDIPTQSQTLASWMNVWFETIALKNVRPKTAATWRSMIEKHIIPAIGSVQLAKLMPSHVRHMAKTIEDKGLSSSTGLLAHRILGVALRDAVREGRTTRNVTELVDAPRKAAKTLAVLTPQDGLKVLHAVTGDPASNIPPDRLASRTWAAFLTGARQGELLGLELDRVGDDLNLSWQLQRLSWEHGCGEPTGHDDKGKPVYPCKRKRGTDCDKKKLTAPADWEHRHLTGGLYLSRPKSDAGWRIIPLVDPLRSIIEQRVHDAASEPNPFGLLWTADPKRDSHGELLPLDGMPVDPRWDNEKWHADLARAGVKDARLHDARHTTASLLRKAGVPIEVITKIMGHSSHAQSVEYMDFDREQLSDALKLASLTLMPAI